MCWPSVAILILLAMFGHDTLMTVEAKPSPGRTPAELVIDLPDGHSAHAAHGGMTSPAVDPHLSHPDADCGVNANPVTLQVRVLELQALPASITPPDLSIPATPAADSPAEHVPHSSVRRALLQVYLI